MSFWRFNYSVILDMFIFIFIKLSFSFDFEFNYKITIILILLLIFVIIVCDLYWLNFTIFFIIKFFDLFFKLVFKLFIHVKFIKLCLFESFVKLFNKEIKSKICPNNQDRQMSYYDIGYDLTTNDFMTNRLFHLFNFDKVQNTTRYESYSKFI